MDLSTISKVLRHRVLKYINLGIAVALLLLAAAAYWYAWRPLPMTSGTVEAPVVAKATVSRDALGVPHIVAGAEPDALFIQGFVTAQDRLFQMDALRRLAAGELAEVFGPGFVASDREARTLRLRRLAEQHYTALVPEHRAALASYARGVNFFLEKNRGRLPLEFSLLRYDPRPWSVTDSLLVALQMVSILSRTWDMEVQKQRLLAAGDPAKVNFLYPVRASGRAHPGSNAWVISGDRTATGRPILANDPHLELTLPSTWYMIHLLAPGLNVTGASLPGLPCVIIGHNDRIAWGITNLQFDVQDLYVEKFDPRTGRYVFRGQVEQARPEREVIQVKGESPVEVVNWVTRNGPVFLAEENRFLSLRWTAAEPTAFAFPFLELNRATDWETFTAALSQWLAPASNFVYADADGNIGYRAAGKFPIRANHSGDVPVDGASGEFDWEGFIPFDQLPSVFNPRSGVIVTANENPFPENYPYRVNGLFDPGYRAYRIRELLSERTDWRPEEMLAIQTDVYSAFSHFLAGEIVAAYERRGADHPALGAAVTALSEWDGQMRADAAAPLLAELVYQQVKRALVERASPGADLVPSLPMTPAVIDTLLSVRPKDWFPDYDSMLLTSLSDAVEEGARMQGRDVSNWRYGHYNRLVLANPVVGRLPFAGRYFNIGPFPMSGSPTTVQQIHGAARIGPSMRMVADLSDWDNSQINITLGQSGQVLSRHYKDQWKVHYEGRSFPMQFQNVNAKHVLTFVPTGASNSR